MRSRKEPGWIARLALMAGLAVAPKALGSEAPPPSATQPERARTDDERVVERLRENIARQERPVASPSLEAAQEAPTMEPPYSVEQRAEILRLGQEAGEELFHTLFDEDLAFARGQANEPGIDPRSLFEMAFHAIEQAKARLPSTLSEDARGRIGTVM